MFLVSGGLFSNCFIPSNLLYSSNFDPIISIPIPGASPVLPVSVGSQFSCFIFGCCHWSIYFQGMRKHVPPFTGSWENHLLKNVLDWEMLVSRRVFAVRTRIFGNLIWGLFQHHVWKNNHCASQPVMISTNHPLHALRAGNKICVNCKDCPWFKNHPKKLS